MIKLVTKSMFLDEWNEWEDRKDTFRYEGKCALYDYLESYEEDTDTPVILDIITLCCEYTEYDSAYDAMYNYQPEDMPVCEDTGVDENGHGMDLVEIQQATEKMCHEWLEEQTTVIDVEGGGVIIANF